MPYQAMTCRVPVPKTTRLIILAAFIALLTACHRPDITAQNDPVRSDSIISRANILSGNGDIAATVHYIDSAYRAFPEAGPVDRWKKYRFLYRFYLDYRSDTLKARAYTDSMRSIIKGPEEGRPFEYAHTLFAEGDVLMAEEKYTEAFRRYYDGREYARKHLDSCAMAGYTYQLAMVRYDQLQIREAIPYFKQALAESRYCGATAGFDLYLMQPQSILHMLGLSYAQLHTDAGKDSAIFYYKRALSLVDSRERQFPEHANAVMAARGEVYGDLGGTYVFQLKDSLATMYLLKSIRINDRPGYNRFGAESAKIDLAYLYIRAAHFEQALALIKELDTGLSTLQFRRLDRTDLMLNLYGIKWHYYDKTRRIDSAYQYHQKVVSYGDSLRKAERELRAADMRASFGHTEMEYRLSLLDRENRLKQFYLVTAVLFSFLIAGMLLLVWYHFKRTRKANRLISSQNKEITEQHLQMQKALSALEQSHADNTRMMQIVAHDLRNPIGGMFSIASLMLDNVERPEEDRIMLELIKTSGKNSLELVSDLLQVHTQTEQLKKEPVDLSQLLHYCVDLLRHKAEAKGQQLELQASSVVIPANREKLWRVVSNLVANAIKFSPTGAAIHIRLQEAVGQVLIAVEDHGIGIPQELAPKIFDMFTDAKRTGTAGEQPFGLGLAISKQIVEAHGGKLWFESKPGNGTTFFVELPVA